MMNKLKDKAASAAKSVKSGSSNLALNIKNGASNLKEKVQGNKSSELPDDDHRVSSSHSPSGQSPATPRKNSTGSSGSNNKNANPSVATVTNLATAESLPMDPEEAQAKEIFKAILDYETDESGGMRSLDLSKKNLESLPSQLKSLRKMRENLQRIDLSHNYIPFFPRELYKWLEVIEVVDISWNRIQRIPDGIWAFSHLTSMNISHNRLEELPEKIGEIKTLQKLDISYNLLPELPSDLWAAASLRELKVSGNRFEKGFPLVICKIERLEVLEIKECFISEIPHQIAWLDKLESLDLSVNKIERLPEEIGFLTNLVELKLEDNPIKSFPLSFAKLKNLKEGGNAILSLGELSLEDEGQQNALRVGNLQLFQHLQQKSEETNYKMMLPPPRPMAPNKPAVKEATAAPLVGEGPSDPEVEKKMAALSDWIVKNSDSTKASLIAIKNTIDKPGCNLEEMQRYATKVDAIVNDLESKKSSLPKQAQRELELPKDDPTWNPIDRVYKHTETKIYFVNTILTMISRHVPTLKHSSKLEEVVSLVKVVRGIQAMLA